MVEEEKLDKNNKEESKPEEEKKIVSEENAGEKKIEKLEGVKEVEIKESIPESLENWQPKTKLGRDVFEGKIMDINEILDSGQRIREYEILDKLVPNMKSELILIGGRTGKGGGIERIPIKTTAAMHKSGRRFTFNAFVALGNEDGLIGMGKGSALESRDAIAKATKKAKLNVIKVKRGCGSWECGCNEPHSIPFKTKGKCGSVRVELIPAPKGVGLSVDDEAKKILKLAGIKDVWIKSLGNTGARINLITAIYNALKKLYIYEK